MRNNCNLLKYIGNFKTVEIKATLKAVIVQCDKTNKSHNVFLVKHEENFKFSHSYSAYLYYRIDISFFFHPQKEISLMKLLMMYSFSFYFF